MIRCVCVNCANVWFSYFFRFFLAARIVGTQHEEMEWVAYERLCTLFSSVGPSIGMWSYVCIWFSFAFLSRLYFHWRFFSVFDEDIVETHWSHCERIQQNVILFIIFYYSSFSGTQSHVTLMHSAFYLLLFFPFFFLCTSCANTEFLVSTAARTYAFD